LARHYLEFAFIMEGDTPAFLNLIGNGLEGHRSPSWGGWGGRYIYRRPAGEAQAIWTQGGDAFARTDSRDAVIGVDSRVHVSNQATIWRWRQAYQHDFSARMDWTIKPFAQANHPPAVVVDGQDGLAPVFIDAEVGKPVTLDASASRDPDGQPLRFRWFLSRSRLHARRYFGGRTDRRRRNRQGHPDPDGRLPRPVAAVPTAVRGWRRPRYLGGHRHGCAVTDPLSKDHRQGGRAASPLRDGRRPPTLLRRSAAGESCRSLHSFKLHSASVSAPPRPGSIGRSTLGRTSRPPRPLDPRGAQVRARLGSSLSLILGEHS
jgi:hypothetical protein